MMHNMIIINYLIQYNNNNNNNNTTITTTTTTGDDETTTSMLNCEARVRVAGICQSTLSDIKLWYWHSHYLAWDIWISC